LAHLPLCGVCTHLGGNRNGEPTGNTSGISRGQPDSDFIVSLGSWTNFEGTVREQAGTFMHELGHNLGLRHGGDDEQLYEPNYLSVMNYAYQTNGLIERQANGTYQMGVLNYSIFGNIIPNLVETSLNEQTGMGGAPPFDTYGIRYFCQPQSIFPEHIIYLPNGPIDWNCNEHYQQATVIASINDGPGIPNQDKGLLTNLTGAYNDWANLVFDGGFIGDTSLFSSHSRFVSSPDQGQNIVPVEITADDAAKLDKPYAITIGYDRQLVVSPGISATVPVTLTNTGTLTSTVTISKTLDNDWFNISAVPITVTLIPRATFSFQIGLNVPNITSTGEIQDVTLKAVLNESYLMSDMVSLSAQVGPLAWFEAEPVTGNIPHTVTFTDLSIGQVDSWQWNFGDGFGSNQQNPTHTYTSPGIYNVYLTVTGPDGSNTYTRFGLIRVILNSVFLPFVKR